MMQSIQLTMFIALGLLLPGSLTLAHDIESEARFLGNEAVLYSHGETSVVFDAFYTVDYGQYLLLDQETSQAMLAAEPPYDHISLVFVSHIHGDHFSPGPTLEYLRAHSDIRLLAPGQVIDAIMENGGSDITAQLERVDLSPGDKPISIDIEGFSIAAVAIPHSGGTRHQGIENLVFRVAIDDGATVAHFGDSATEKRWFAPLGAFLEPVDAAFVPYWFFSAPEGREIITDLISAEHTIGIHVPARWRGSGPQARSSVNADLFTDPGEKRVFKRSDDQP